MAVYTQTSLEFNVVELKSSAKTILLEFLSDASKIVILCVYESPDNSDGLLIPSLLERAMNAVSMKNAPLLICGDFNFPFVNWRELHTLVPRFYMSPFIFNCGSGSYATYI